MRTVGAVIESIECALGEQEHSYTNVANFDATMAATNMSGMPKMFGLGSYRKTEKDIFDLGIESAAKTLARSGLAPKEIDFIVFCSTRIPGSEIEHIEYNVRLMQELDLSSAYPIGITLNNCSSFISAIVMASSMVTGEAYKNILIVTADKVYDENIRLNNFALLSDAAASCIVTNRPARGYRLMADKFGVSKSPISTNHGQDDPTLYSSVLADLLAVHDVPVDKIRKVFCSNVFRPITSFRERKLGFSSKQLFLDNVQRYGHCFSADAFINLIEYSATGPTEEGDLFVLSADAPNLRSSILIQSIGDETQPM